MNTSAARHSTAQCSAHLIPRVQVQVLPEHREAQAAAGAVGGAVLRHLLQLLLAHARPGAVVAPVSRAVPAAAAARAACLKGQGHCYPAALLLFLHTILPLQAQQTAGSRV
jgi:hypothetical protein